MIIDTRKEPFTPSGAYVPYSVTRGPGGLIVSCARDGDIRGACRACIFKRCCQPNTGIRGKAAGR